MKKLRPVHPGEILKKDFLDKMNISPSTLSKTIGIDSAKITQVIKGKRKMTANLASLLGKFFKNSPQFWLNIQKLFDSAIETSHLLSTQANKKRLKDSIRELKEGDIVRNYKVPASKTGSADRKPMSVVKKSIK